MHFHCIGFDELNWTKKENVDKNFFPKTGK